MSTPGVHIGYAEWILEKQRLAGEYADLAGWELQLLDTTIEDHIGQLWNWPVKYARLCISKHLRYQERFTLTMFLLGNRLPPVLLAEWYLKRNMLADESARKCVSGIIKMHRTGELETRNYKTYVMGATDKNGNVGIKIQSVPTPNYCFDENDKPRDSTDPIVADWVAAEQMLNSGTVSLFQPI